MKRTEKRAFEFAARQPWAITEEHLSLILEIAQRTHEPDFTAVAQAQPDRSKGVRDTYGSVAVINAIGPIFRYANLFTAISGATSIQELAAEFRSAVEDPSITAIVLNVDSPGGEVAGTSELSKAVYAARSSKPIVAYVDDYAASAAYWIASAADRIVASPTARLGSIGVLATVTKKDPEPGAKSYEFVSSVSPKKTLSLDTEQGRAEIQGAVDDLANVFVADVARNRGVSAEKVLADFGQGGLMIAAKAVTAGLADEIGSFDELVGALAKPQKALKMFGKNSVASATNPQEKSMEENKPAETAQPPAVDVNALVTKARTEGFAEAGMIADLCAIAGKPELAVKYIGEKKTTDQVRAELLAARVKQDGPEVDPSVMPGADTGTEKPKVEGKAKPWGAIFKSLGIKTKGGN